MFSDDYKKIREYNGKLNEKIQMLETNQASIYGEIKKFVGQQQSILNQPISEADRGEPSEITQSQIVADSSEIERLSKQLTQDPKNHNLLDQMLKMIATQNKKIILLDRTLTEHKRYLSTQVKRFSFSMGEQFPLVVFNENDQKNPSGPSTNSQIERNRTSTKNGNIFDVEINASNVGKLNVSEIHPDRIDDLTRDQTSNSNGKDTKDVAQNSNSNSKHMSLRASRQMTNSNAKTNPLQQSEGRTPSSKDDPQNKRRSSQLIETGKDGSQVRKTIEMENERALKESGLDQKRNTIHYSDFSLDNNFDPENIPEQRGTDGKESSLFGDELDRFKNGQNINSSSKKQLQENGLTINGKLSSQKNTPVISSNKHTSIHQTNSTANTNTPTPIGHPDNQVQASANTGNHEEMTKRCKELIKSNHLLSLILENRNLAISSAEKQNMELLLFIKQMRIKSGMKDFNEEDIGRKLTAEIEQLANARNNYLSLLGHLKSSLHN
jgi:hypothetical protein